MLCGASQWRNIFRLPLVSDKREAAAHLHAELRNVHILFVNYGIMLDTRLKFLLSKRLKTY